MCVSSTVGGVAGGGQRVGVVDRGLRTGGCGASLQVNETQVLIVVETERLAEIWLVILWAVKLLYLVWLM